MRPALTLILALCLAGCSAAISAPASMRLTSAAVGADGRIAARQSAYGQNRSPPLTWSAVAGAKSYAIILDDPDAAGPRPFVHWTIWNIPAGVTSLPEGLATGGTPPNPRGARQGANDAGGIGYFGPRPPSGVHHYRFEIYALDAPLALAPGATRAALAGALRGHVLASGELKADFAAP